MEQVIMIVVALAIVFFVLVLVMGATKGDESRGIKNRGKKEPIVEVRQPNSGNGIEVAFDNTPLKLKRGWTTKRGKHYGYYRTRYGAWKGQIERRGDKFNVFIFSPPTEALRLHNRWHCFKHLNGERWKMHLATSPSDRDIGAIIYYIESVIVQSFKMV